MQSAANLQLILSLVVITAEDGPSTPAVQLGQYGMRMRQFYERRVATSDLQLAIRPTPLDPGPGASLYPCDTALAGWQSGYAEDCKSSYSGSIPLPASRERARASGRLDPR